MKKGREAKMGESGKLKMKDMKGKEGKVGNQG